MTHGDEFLGYSREIAQSFLQTVVAVDDHLEFTHRPTAEEADVDLIEPDEDDSGVGTVEAKTVLPEAGEDSRHKLYYQELSLAFAAKGVVCGGFIPERDNDQSKQKIVSTSKNADITILDWQMDVGGPHGQLAKETISEIAKNDIRDGGRLRLICIYTAENIEAVITSLITHLTKYAPISEGPMVTFHESLLTHWKIQIISKNETNETQLPELLINSFSQLTAGLLSNAALAAITEIRDKTHNYLHKFNRKLDPAYIAHILGLISSPAVLENAHEVAFDYAVDLISEDLKSELQISQNLKKSLAKEVISSWPNYINPSNSAEYFALKVGEDADGYKFNNQTMTKLLNIKSEEELRDVLENDLKMASKKARDKFERNPILLTTDNETGHMLELCSIESTRRDSLTARDHIPVLRQGTIIKTKSDNPEYFVCVQPVCDSIRLCAPSSFSLLKINTSDLSSFTHVIRDKDSTYLILKIAFAPKNLRTHFFEPDYVHKVVKAEKISEEYLFNHGTDNTVFVWCGELKQPISQAIVNNLAAQLSRVGLDSFEWLRQKA